jgi:predicted dehydrogenase
MTSTSSPNNNLRPARIAVIGAAWWSQGWHIPQLRRNPNAKIVAIMQRSEQPTAAAFLNLTLKTKTQLKEEYDVPIYSSCEEMLEDKELMEQLDGVIICTAHSCHSWMGKMFLDAGKHILMEKPMTVDVAEARNLAKLATEAGVTFMVNNTANYRKQYFEARKIINSGEIGEINHILCVMYSPLMFLFDDAKNASWVKPSGSMVQSDGSGNGFGWGQSSHVLAWVLGVGKLDVTEVTAMTHRSENSGADLMDAALIRCKNAQGNNSSISFSAGCGWPGNSYGENPRGKHFDIKIFASKGVLIYGGDDNNPKSGQLEVRYHDEKKDSYIAEGGFLMENGEVEGNGPESLKQFISACRGLPFENGADQNVGLQAVRVLDAMYRSAASGKSERTK